MERDRPEQRHPRTEPHAPDVPLGMVALVGSRRRQLVLVAAAEQHALDDRVRSLLYHSANFQIRSNVEGVFTAGCPCAAAVPAPIARRPTVSHPRTRIVAVFNRPPRCQTVRRRQCLLLHVYVYVAKRTAALRICKIVTLRRAVTAPTRKRQPERICHSCHVVHADALVRLHRLRQRRSRKVCGASESTAGPRRRVLHSETHGRLPSLAVGAAAGPAEHSGSSRLGSSMIQSR